MRFSRVRGTQDIVDLKDYNFILEKIRKHLQDRNFSQIQTPILEHTSLFVRSLGEHTDVVHKEMYILEKTSSSDASSSDNSSIDNSSICDSSSGASICLRPEATAGTMRAFIENNVESKPWRVWSHGSMFRRERPQKGRWREFEQINIEVIDSESISQDAYFIKMLDSFFANKLLLNDYVVKLNFLGCLEDRKNHKDELLKYLEKVKSNLCETCLVRKDKNILRVLDCKNEDCKKVLLDAPKITDCLCKDCNSEWGRLKELLEILSVSFIEDKFLVRGLDYYEKTVFEFSSKDLGAQDAFCGGGRYDLGQELGAKCDVKSIGAAIGAGRLLILLNKVRDMLSIKKDSALNLILPMGQEQIPLALLLSDIIHGESLCADILLDLGSMKSMMRKANKMLAARVIIIGEDEQKNGTVTVKNMTTGESVVVKQVELLSVLK